AACRPAYRFGNARLRPAAAEAGSRFAQARSSSRSAVTPGIASVKRSGSEPTRSRLATRQAPFSIGTILTVSTRRSTASPWSSHRLWTVAMYGVGGAAARATEPLAAPTGDGALADPGAPPAPEPVFTPRAVLGGGTGFRSFSVKAKAAIRIRRLPLNGTESWS